MSVALVVSHGFGHSEAPPLPTDLGWAFGSAPGCPNGRVSQQPPLWAVRGATGCPNIGVSQDLFLPRHTFLNLGSGRESLPTDLGIWGRPRLPKWAGRTHMFTGGIRPMSTWGAPERPNGHVSQGRRPRAPKRVLASSFPFCTFLHGTAVFLLCLSLSLHFGPSLLAVRLQVFVECHFGS